MENILSVFDLVIAKLGELRNLANKALETLASEQQRADAVKIEQEDKTIELEAREKEVKKIEDIVALKASAQALVEQSQKAANELLEAQKIFNAEVIKKNKEIAETKAENERVRLKNENETQSLIKARQELEEEKKNYKMKLAQGIINQAEKV